MKNKIFVSVVFLMLSSLALASNIPIHLGGGTIKPKQEIKIPLDKLAPNVAYNVSCKISSPKTKVPVGVRVEKHSGIFADYKLNGQYVGSSSFYTIFNLSQYHNDFEASPIYKRSESINFTNLGQLVPVEFDCYATPITK